VEIIKALNPRNKPGKLTLMTRMGPDALSKHLPELAKAVQESDLNVIWCCDPMHGNTRTTAHGYKTRDVHNIKKEVEVFFDVLRKEGCHPGGVHIEMTGDDVTECVCNNVKESD